MAKELENPFGDDTNDVPIVNGHERFVEALTQLFYAQIPEDQMFVDKPDQVIDDKPETAKPKPEPVAAAPAPSAPAAATKPKQTRNTRHAGAALAASVQLLVDRLDSSVQSNTTQLRELHTVLADVATMRQETIAQSQAEGDLSATVNEISATKNAVSRMAVVDQENMNTPRPGAGLSGCCQTAPALPPRRT